MAKTKRRQLAALAAQAELKDLAGYNERTTSCDKSGPSGTGLQTGDHTVEIRTQRVIFKIPALPQKPAADTQSLKIAKEAPGNRKREKPKMDIDPSSEQVPADEAKISKGIFQFGKWKRHKRIGDLLPSEAKAVPSSAAGLSNGGQLSSVAKPVATDKHQNGQLPLSGAGSEVPSENTVKLTTGPRKRAKLQEMVVRPPAEKNRKVMKTPGKFKEPVGSTLNRAANSFVASKRIPRDLVVKDTDRLKDLAKASDGVLPSTLAHSPLSRKRRRGNIKEVISHVPVSPKATGLSQHRTRSRVKISHCEAMALEVLQEIQNVKTIASMENSDKIAENDNVLVRSADAEPICTTRHQSQTEPQTSGNFTGQVAQEKEQLAHLGVAVDSSSHELAPRGPHTSFHTCSQGDGPGDVKSHLQIEERHTPFALGKQRQLVVVPEQGKDLGKSPSHSGGKCIVPRGAEMIKRDSQLTTMEKRLEAAGGLTNWLLDKGLGQFLPVIEKWNIDNLSLMQLTMEGLKSMGLLPVGPRRKLIHAISSLTLPSFSKASPMNANPR